MHHILNFEQIFIENIFIEYEYYYDSSLRRAGTLLAERKHAFFDKRCQAVSSICGLPFYFNQEV